MRLIESSFLLAVCLLLGACDRPSSAPPPDLLKAQRAEMERAKATEKVMQDAAKRTDEQIESQQK